jgi:hypothetical protein
LPAGAPRGSSSAPHAARGVDAALSLREAARPAASDLVLTSAYGSPRAVVEHARGGVDTVPRSTAESVAFDAAASRGGAAAGSKAAGSGRRDETAARPSALVGTGVRDYYSEASGEGAPKTSTKLRGTASRVGSRVGAIGAVDPTATDRSAFDTTAVAALPHRTVDRTVYTGPLVAREASDAPLRPPSSLATEAEAEETAPAPGATPPRLSTTRPGEQPKPWRGRRTKRGGVIVRGGNGSHTGVRARRGGGKSSASTSRMRRGRRGRRKAARERSAAIATKTSGTALETKTGELEKLLAEFDDAEEELGGGETEHVASSSPPLSSLRPSSSSPPPWEAGTDPENGAPKYTAAPQPSRYAAGESDAAGTLPNRGALDAGRAQPPRSPPRNDAVSDIGSDAKSDSGSGATRPPGAPAHAAALVDVQLSTVGRVTAMAYEASYILAAVGCVVLLVVCTRSSAARRCLAARRALSAIVPGTGSPSGGGPVRSPAAVARGGGSGVPPLVSIRRAAAGGARSFNGRTETGGWTDDDDDEEAWGAEDDEWEDLFADPSGPPGTGASIGRSGGGAADVEGDAATTTLAAVSGNGAGAERKPQGKSPKPIVAPKVTTTSRLSLQVPTKAPPAQVSARAIGAAASVAAPAGRQPDVMKEEDDFFGSVRSPAARCVP